MSAKPDKPTFKAEEAIVSAVYAIAIVGAYCWIFYGFAGRDLGTIVLVFGVPVLAFTSTVIHEAGHAIGALIAGWRPIVVSAWPFAWHVPNNAIVIFGKGSGYDGGGYVAGVPRSLRQNTRARFGVFVAAGPLISLVLAIALIAAAASVASATQLPDPRFALPDAYDYQLFDGRVREFEVNLAAMSHRNDESQALIGAMMALAFLSFATFVNTIVPREYGESKSTDGKMLLDLLKPGSTSYSAGGCLRQLLHYNVRLRDLPEWMLEAYRAETEQYGEAASGNDTLDIGRTLDAKVVDAAKARAQVDCYRSAYGNDDWLASIDAWIAAIHENDTPRAAAALSDRPGEVSDTPMLSAAEAALAARTGDAQLVDRKLDEMEARLRRDSPFPNPTFEDIRRQIEAVAKQTIPQRVHAHSAPAAEPLADNES